MSAFSDEQLKQVSRMQSCLVRITMAVLLGAVLMTMTAPLAGCTLRAGEDIRKVMAHLEEKYPGHTFEIVQYQGPGLPGTNPVVEMYCRPDGADFVFRARIRLSTGEISDAYASAYSSKKISDYVVASFEARGVRMITAIGALMTSQDDFYAGPPIEDTLEYLDTIRAITLTGDLLIDESSIEEDSFGETLEATMREFSEWTGRDVNVIVLVAPGRIVREAERVYPDMPRIDAGSWPHNTEHTRQYRCVFFYQIKDGIPSLSVAELNDYLREGYRDERFL